MCCQQCVLHEKVWRTQTHIQTLYTYTGRSLIYTPLQKLKATENLIIIISNNSFINVMPYRLDDLNVTISIYINNYDITCAILSLQTQSYEQYPVCLNYKWREKVTESPKARNKKHLDILFIQSYLFTKFSVKLLCINIPSNSRRILLILRKKLFE